MTKRQRRKSRIFTAILAVVIAVGAFPNLAMAATVSASDIQSKINGYYSSVSANGVPHWNANHTEATLKSNAGSKNYTKDITYSECKGKVRDTGCSSNTFGGG